MQRRLNDWKMRFDGDLRRLENEARPAHRGLWIDRNPKEPWNFRHRQLPPQDERPLASIAITYLHCNGSGEKEPDEYVEIQNRMSGAMDLSGWVQQDEGIKHSIRFPSGFLMQPAQKCKIYTNLETGCLSFYETDSAVWNNNNDRAYFGGRRSFHHRQTG